MKMKKKRDGKWFFRGVTCESTDTVSIVLKMIKPLRLDKKRFHKKDVSFLKVPKKGHQRIRNGTVKCAH